MKNIFRMPVDNQHFKETIELGKKIDEVMKFLPEKNGPILQRISQDGFLYYWGSIPGESNNRNFDKLKESDEILCYRSGKYIASGTIAYKTISKELARHSWGETELKTTWELIYFIKDVEFFQIDSGTINKEFGFSEGPVMGFNTISEEKVKKFYSKYTSLRQLVQKYKGFDSQEERLIKKTLDKDINSRYEAQFYLVDLGNQLEYETYVPASDAGHEVFGKRLDEVITVRKSELDQYVAPAIIDPFSNIDVVWFKESYRPRIFFEVIHKTGWSEALLRLDAVSQFYESAKTRLIGPKENEVEFENAVRRWSGPRGNLKYKNYNDLLHTHTETLHFKDLVSDFLN